MDLVIDLEATCDSGSEVPREEMEIIEIGAVFITHNTQHTFQQFVRPVLHPELTPFCKGLTSIRQEDVDAGVSFPEALALLTAWVESICPGRKGFSSWGAYDLGQFRRDIARHRLPTPEWMTLHENLKQGFADYNRCRPCGMAQALQKVCLPLKGTHHRALSDAENIAQLIPYSRRRVSSGRTEQEAYFWGV